MQISDNTSICKLSYERGPIRPPSEASSLLIRLSRNCPWNRCSFCPVYKDTKFQKRPLEETLGDIDAIHKIACFILDQDRQTIQNYRGEISEKTFKVFLRNRNCNNAFRAVALWLFEGAETVFLQDADPLAAPPDEILKILWRIKACFPFARRITCYARSRTTAKWKPEDLYELEHAGLRRIHTGIESGNRKVLDFVNKGVSRENQIEGGLKIKSTGIELSLYVMPGLGGRTLSTAHINDTAKVLNAVEPDFLRIRSLHIVPGTVLNEKFNAGLFYPLNEQEKIGEIKELISQIKRCRIRIESDHALNLLENIEGDLPDDYTKLMARIRKFEILTEEEQEKYIIGKRAMIFRSLEDLKHPDRSRIAAAHIKKMKALGMTPDEYIHQCLALHL